MSWKFAYTPMLLPSALTALMMLTLSIFAWRRRSMPGALPLAIAALFAAFWTAGSALQIAAIDVAAKILWFKFQGIWQLPTITALTCFLLEFAWPGRYLTRRNLLLLTIPCLLFLGMALTNESYHLAWYGFTYEGIIVPKRALGNWVIVAYGFGLIIVNIIVVIWLFLHSPQNRWLAVLMLISLLAAWVIYLLEAGGGIHSLMPIDVLVNALSFMVYTVALFRFRILDPIPLAHQMAIEQLEAGMLILDPHGRIINLNPSGAAILGAPVRQLVRQQIQGLLPECAGLMENVHIQGPNRIEISLKNGLDTRHYYLTCSALYDWRELMVGFLVLLHDVTSQMQVQAKLIEQQQVLATLKEREQIARELHDELAQELAMINVQAQLVSGLLEVGEDEQARNQLQLLAKTTRESQVGIRGQTKELSLNIDPEVGILEELRSFLDIFRQMYGIEAELILPDLQSMISMAPVVEVQLLRIVQEAFTNIRKHAQAKKVLLSLRREAGYLKLIIEDDGIGFDPDRLPSPGHSFGLGIMSARARDVGGNVAIHSNPGQGTRIVVVVPCTD